MAPPIPLSSVAGTLALSFTAGRAAPTTTPTPAPVQQPSVPAPPRLPPVPGETTAEPPTPETDATATPPGDATATPEPPSQTEPPLLPDPSPQPELVDPLELDTEEAPLARERPEATSARLLRPNTRKLMFNLFVGGSKALRGGYSYLGGTDFKFEGAFGGFDEDFRVGGFAVFQMTSGLPFNAFTVAPRLSLNRQIVPDHAIYLTTNLTLGYRVVTYGTGYDGGNVYGGDGYGSSYDSDSGNIAFHSAVMGVSWGVTAIVAERLMLSFRPLDLELMVPSPALVQVNWSAMGGMGVLLGRSRNDDER